MSRLTELSGDIAQHVARLGDTDFTRLSKDQLAKVVQVELADNILPLLQGIVEATAALAKDTEENLEDLAGAIDGILDESDDMLQPDTTASIMGVFELGGAIAEELKALMAKVSVDPARRQRLMKLMATYAASVETVGTHLLSVTLNDDDDDDDKETTDDHDADGVESDDSDDDDQDDANTEVTP